ncbi:MAG: hypothetical protein DDT42_02073 [candidate division WS2 bacterium]|uniref:DUF3048 domain-containing protein n=1 Tax=Psychracetigena formicireducens TaxID=2986056 RepID=A0A9E2BIF8_PSYF1|nr:hypothetical protein [Candidatus Psychracetigena formicireducens]
MLGIPFNDRVTREQIRAKNVIICFSDFSNSRSAIGEQKVNIRTIGTGSAIFYLDGKKTAGTWRRDVGKPIKFYNSDGEDLKVNAGTTWIQVVPQGTQVK